MSSQGPVFACWFYAWYLYWFLIEAGSERQLVGQVLVCSQSCNTIFSGPRHKEPKAFERFILPLVLHSNHSHSWLRAAKLVTAEAHLIFLDL